MTTAQTIVVAWTEDIMVPTGKLVATDLGRRADLKAVTVAHACVWLLKGTEADEDRACAHVVADHPDTGRVYTWPTTEADPIGRAKNAILAFDRAVKNK